MLDRNGKIDINHPDVRIPDNGFVGRRVDGNSWCFVNIGHNPELIKLMSDKEDPSAWDKFCDLIGDFDPRGRVYIDYIVVNGEPKVFH